MELKRYIKILQNWWWLVLASFLIVTIAGFAFSFTREPLFNASITMIVGPRNSITDVAALRQTLDTLDNPNILNTYAEVMRSQSIYEQSLETMGLSTGTVKPASIEVSVIQNTNLIKVYAEGTNPAAVYKMVNAIADNGMNYVNTIYELYEMKVLDGAAMPTRPFSPDVLRDTLLSAALGLLLGVTLSFLAEYIKKPLETLDQLSIMDRDTSLYNRRYFLQRLKQEMARLKRNNLPLAVCLIELSARDDIGDTYPKQIIKRVSARASAYLKRHIRQNEILARWEGSTLAWLLLDTNESAARQGIERLAALLETKIFEDDETGITFTFTAAFGAAVIKSPMPEKEYLALCEQNLRQAQALGAANIHVTLAADSASAAAQPGPAGKAA